MSKNSTSEGGRPDAQNQVFLVKVSKRLNDEEEEIPLKSNKKRKSPLIKDTKKALNNRNQSKGTKETVKNSEKKSGEEETMKNDVSTQKENRISQDENLMEIETNAQEDKEGKDRHTLNQNPENPTTKEQRISNREENARINDNNNISSNEEEIIMDLNEIIEEYIPPETFDIIFFEIDTRKDLEEIIGLCMEQVKNPEEVYTQEARQYNNKNGQSIVVIPFTSREARGEAFQGIGKIFSDNPSLKFCTKFYIKEEDQDGYKKNFEQIPQACIINGALSFTKVKPSENSIRSVVRKYIIQGNLIRVAIYRNKNFISLIMDNIEDYIRIVDMEQIHGEGWHIRILHAACKVQSENYYRLRFAPFPPNLCYAGGIRAIIRKLIKEKSNLDPETIISAGQVRKERINTGAGYGFVVVHGKETVNVLRRCTIPNKTKKRVEKTLENGNKIWVEEDVVYKIGFSLFEASKNW